MPRAEAGTTKAIANQMKAKGLQRLRFYCQACQRQMRDENGFKCHVASESHVRNMMTIGEDPRRAINEFSIEFKRDFVQLLRTGHGEKAVNANHFYQEYIGNKQHVHMNATKWSSLTDFCKYLGREGIVRVDLDEKNEERGGASALMISWIDNSPEALRRQEALKKRDRQDRGDEEREQRLIEAQIRKARRQAAGREQLDDQSAGEDEEQEEAAPTLDLKRADREKIKLSFGPKKMDKESEPQKLPSPPLTTSEKSATPEKETLSFEQSIDPEISAQILEAPQAATTISAEDPESEVAPASAPSKVSIKPMSLGSLKPKNVFASAGKKNAFGGMKKAAPIQQQKPTSEAERIMKEEIERKRQRELNGGNQAKRQRIF